MIKMLFLRRNHGLLLFAAILSGAMLGDVSVMASDSCVIRDDAGLYEERKEQSILLMQYGNQVLRATDGKIRCGEDAASARLICSVDGKGEILIEGSDRGPRIITLTTDEMGEVHVYATGDLSCGLKSDFNSN